MWTFVSKIGIALAPALVGLVLSLSGFTPDAVQTPGTLLAIRVLIGPVPVAIFLAGILIIERYPLDEMTYEGIVGGKEWPAGRLTLCPRPLASRKLVGYYFKIFGGSVIEMEIIVLSINVWLLNQPLLSPSSDAPVNVDKSKLSLLSIISSTS